VKLNGLSNNMAMTGLQKQSVKPSSTKAAKSFEEVLEKTNPSPTVPQKKIEKEEARDSKPEMREQEARYAKPGRDQTSSRRESQNSEDQKPSLSNALENKLENKTELNPDQASVESVEGDSLPLQPSAPSLNGPINDRLATGKPVGETSLISTGAKEKTIVPQEDGIDSLTRRVVWNDFLRKMKDDLGVSAEDVLSAFASLSDEELAAPPQETVGTVVAALGLNAEQAQLAKGYFNELVAKTKSQSMGEELGKSQKQINLTLMSQREAQRKSLNRGIDQLQQNFFMKNPQASVQMTQPGEEGPRSAAAPFSNMEMIEVEAPASTIPGMSVSAPPANFPPAPMAAASEIPSPVGAKVKAAPKNTIDEMVRQFLAPQAKMETLKAGQMSAAPVAAAQAGGASAVGAEAATQAAAAGSMSAGSLKGLLADLSSSYDSDEDGEYSSDASYLTAGLAGEQKTHNLNGPSPEFQAELTKAAKEPMSVPDLVDKAQMMVHEGGGEMKVTLSNEGMGEVAMKVSVHEGKVQVQMITESDEAKKLIERQLGELKSSLHANDLKLDTIKIDTASNLGKQLEQQYQDAQRQATQTAWEQFRQDNQGWRRSFFETPSAKLYKGQGEAPRDVEAPGATVQQRKAYNRRLDLVA